LIVPIAVTQISFLREGPNNPVFGTRIRMDPDPHNGWIRIQILEGKNDTKSFQDRRLFLGVLFKGFVIRKLQFVIKNMKFFVIAANFPQFLVIKTL
jgi:hypothetical protein